MVLASKIPYFPLNSLNREIKAGFKPKSRIQTRSCSLLALLTFALIRDVMTTEWRLLFPWKPTHPHRTPAQQTQARISRCARYIEASVCIKDFSTLSHYNHLIIGLQIDLCSAYVTPVSNQGRTMKCNVICGKKSLVCFNRKLVDESTSEVYSALV